MKKLGGIMARPIILSNGNLHVGLNIYGEVHDFYYPYVGLENHAAAKSLRHRVGLWVEGHMTWLDDGKWKITHNYHSHSLIGYIMAHHEEFNITLEFDDCVDSDRDAFIRNIHVINGLERQREIRLFMHQVFDIGDSAGNGDTVQFLPDNNAILTYRGARVFVINGQHASSKHSFDQHSMGLFGIEGYAGTYVDAEDGVLEGNNVQHGRVDSCIGFTLLLDAHSSARVHYWIAAGTSLRQALDIDKQIRELSPTHCLLSTNSWWRAWLKPAEVVAQNVDEEFRASFIKSILIIKAHIDNRGAVIASTDTTMLKYFRDAYGYCWTRDASYCLWPLIRLGYRKEPEAFFAMCKRVLNKNGYIMHKYQADGSLGSSWHPYLHTDGSIAPPIQEDETAIVLFLFNEYYQLHKDEAFLSEYYADFVKPMAKFLAGYVDVTTGLPKASYDLWEETYLTSTYTTAVVSAALLAAAELAATQHDESNAVRWRTASEDMASCARKLLYNDKRKNFHKGLTVKNGEITHNETIDASALYGGFMFNLFPIMSEEMTQSVETTVTALRVGGDLNHIGIARYENDHYSRISDTITGNPWFVTTLWLAQYYRDAGKVEEAKEIVRWCQLHMTQSGVLSEQINPYTNEFVSVAPLAWSQAEYVSTLLDLI